MRRIAKGTIILSLVLFTLACGLPFLRSEPAPNFDALQTAARATVDAAATVNVLYQDAATAIAQTVIATNRATSGVSAVTPAATGITPSPDGSAATAQAISQATAQAGQATQAWLGTQAALAATQTILARPTSQPPPQPQPQVPVVGRIQFTRGATSGYTTNQLPGGAIVDYLVDARSGQTMLASVSSPNSNVYLGVSGVSDGAVLLPLSARRTDFTGALPATQDYRLTLAAPPEGSQFTLQVIIPARIQFAAGAFSASLPGQLAADETNFYLANARRGQTMTVRVFSPTNLVFLTIYGLVDGQPLVRSVMAQTEWTGELPMDQDYMIQTVNEGQATGYTLEVTIR